jgi:hypothetical protein
MADDGVSTLVSTLVSTRAPPRAGGIACASKVIRSERARINGAAATGRLPRLLMQVKAPKVGAMSLIVLSGSIG